MHRMNRHIQIVLGSKQGKMLDEEAKRNGMPTATLIRMILYRHLNNKTR